MQPEYEVTLNKLVYGGDALGRLPDDRAVFVPFALPEERVRIRLTEEKPRYARGELLQVLQPSSERIPPRCSHFGTCGGCHYQQMSYTKQLQAKTEILIEQMERIGGISSPPVQPIIPSPNTWNYRNQVQFHLTTEGRVGYLAARSQQAIRIEECHLPEPPINRLWPALDIEPIPGLQRVGIRLGEADELMLVLEGKDPTPPEFQVELPLSAVYRGPGKTTLLAGDDHLSIPVLDKHFHVSATSFFQVNTPMAGAMVEHVLANLPPDPQMTVIDAYCGVGLFSLFLAPRVSKLIGIEQSPSACYDFSLNLDEYDHVELHPSAVDEILPHLESHPDVILVDPPRAGLGRRVRDAILALEPMRVIYVSCDPATLARDARHLIAGGYRLIQITPFDLFPQTYHLESISLFECQKNPL